MTFVFCFQSRSFHKTRAFSVPIHGTLLVMVNMSTFKGTHTHTQARSISFLPHMLLTHLLHRINNDMLTAPLTHGCFWFNSTCIVWNYTEWRVDDYTSSVKHFFWRRVRSVPVWRITHGKRTFAVVRLQLQVLFISVISTDLLLLPSDAKDAARARKWCACVTWSAPAALFWSLRLSSGATVSFAWDAFRRPRTNAAPTGVKAQKNQKCSANEMQQFELFLLVLNKYH